MKKFFKEFKTFITRGNVVDMAVGVIVGSSFTAIVNGMSNFILKPIINFLLAVIFGKDSLSEVYTFLQKTVLEDGTVDLANSIYIDWGSFINAVLNFFIVAFVLFTIVKIINRFRAEHKSFAEKVADGRPCREDRKEMRRRGIRFSDKAAVAAYYAEQAAEEAAAKKAAADEAAAKAAAERAANPTAEDLLKDILAELQKK